MTEEFLRHILSGIEILDRSFEIERVFNVKVGIGWHVHVIYTERDVDSPDPEPRVQRSRGWFVGLQATEVEVLQTALAAVLRSYEHVVRENFYYHGSRIFSPHPTMRQLATDAPRKP